MEESSKHKNDNRENDIVFSKIIKAGKRIYYLDVKKNRKNELFLAITESRKVHYPGKSSAIPQIEKHKIFLYKEDFEKFLTSLNESIQYIKENNTVNFAPLPPSEENAPSIEPIIEEINLKVDF